MPELINKLIIQSQKITPKQLAWLIDRAGAAPFAEDLLEVDEPLWGGFWQGDVVAPGYYLPAVELALLRATRLDATWPEGTSVPQFLADLRQAIADPYAGVWTLAVGGEPCVIFASIRHQGLATVVWYCTTTERLHAGYRTAVTLLNFRGAKEQRRPGDSGVAHSPPEHGRRVESTPHPELSQPGWLARVMEQAETIGSRQTAAGGRALATRLDAEILWLRLQIR